MLIALGLLPKLGTVVASIPQPVLGGAGLAAGAHASASSGVSVEALSSPSTL